MEGSNLFGLGGFLLFGFLLRTLAFVISRVKNDFCLSPEKSDRVFCSS